MKIIKVILIEDDPDLLADLSVVLRTYDIEAEPIEPPRAEKRLAKGGLDCIILDLKMPPPDDMTDEETDCGRVTGVVLCRRLRDIDEDIPILVLTSVTDPEAQKLVLAAGANRILNKPVYPDEIVQQIKLLVPN